LCLEAKHLENTRVSCDICGRFFKTRDVLRKHKKADHSF
jgi:hypothetical protein